MFDFIEKLRQKPPGAKKKIAFLMAFSFTALIFIIWLSIVYPAVWRDHLQEEKVANLEPGPLDKISDLFGDAFSEINDNISEAKSVISSISSSTEYYGTASSSPKTDYYSTTTRP